MERRASKIIGGSGIVRYYAPWLGRWVSCDPLGIVDGNNLYVYARNNPLA